MLAIFWLLIARISFSIARELLAGDPMHGSRFPKGEEPFSSRMTDFPDQDVHLFTEALNLRSAERAQYLDRACAGNAELRARIEALLKAFEQANDFLVEPAAGVPVDDTLAAGSVEKAGDRIGHFKLLQQIGEGGCGVVFMAEQEEPLHRRVALKIVKPGMDTKNVIARFEAERQALALMDHPNIAQVFDAGATASGRPYFVMELVRGVKITEYCDQNSLPTKERLELFIKVCGAIQHAHQKGIIHRDIKPSNILVTTAADGTALPKIIDFGIAKATTGQRLTDKTLFTAFEMLIGTPAYMSPEQATLTSVDVDTRSDIYSLGVLLYELLTSTTPFDTAELLKAGLDEVRRVIREQEPARPSTRLSTMVAADLTNVSHHRGAEPPKLIRDVRGDLDWIVMKAMEKDRARRYATANGLAEDVKRFLANDAISARPPSRSYRLYKLIKRNRILFGALAVLGAILIISLVTVILALAKAQAAYREVDRARRQVEADNAKVNAQMERSQEVSRFLEEMLEEVGPSKAMGRDTGMLTDILNKTAVRLETQLTNEPQVQAELRQQLGHTYLDLSELPQAEAMLRQALAIRTNLFGEDSEPASDSMIDLGDALVSEWKSTEGEALIQKALAVRIQLLGNNNAKVADSYVALAYAFFNERRWTDAEAAVRKSIGIYSHLFGDHDPRLGHPRVALGSAVYVQGKVREAEEIFREAVSDLMPGGADNVELITAQEHLAVALAEQHKFTEAEAFFRKNLAARRKIYPPDHPETVAALRQLAQVLMDQGKYAQAESFLRQLLPLERKNSGETSPEAIGCLQNLVSALAGERKYDEAETLLARELTSGSEPKPQSFGLVRIRRDLFARQGRWNEAVTDAALLVKQRPNDSESYHGLAPLLVALKDDDKYKQLCREIIAQFAGTTNIYDADRMAKDCLIMPLPGVDLEPVAAMAETAVSGSKELPSYPFFQCCKALAEYRQGHFEEAINWAGSAVKPPFPYSKAEGYAILAMAQFKSGNANESRSALTNCDLVIETKLPELNGADLGNDWRDWIIVRVLRSEAERLIKGDNKLGENSPPN
jgi:serine/threonine protein kinase